ncbi:MAG: helix-turn-helix domain-containing protein [Minisyncoccia bacterium]
MKNKKKHISKEERFFIEKMLKTGTSLSSIAEILDRGLATISEEVNRNGGKDKYSSQTSQDRADSLQDRKKEHSNKLLRNKALKKFVDKNLLEGLSPEMISNLSRKKSSPEYVSSKSIRKYLKGRLI